MSKICLIALFVLFTVTAITSRSTDTKRIARSSNDCSVASKVGDSCHTDDDCRCENSEMKCLFSFKKSTLECQVDVPDPKYPSEAMVAERIRKQKIAFEKQMKEAVFNMTKLINETRT